MLFPSVQLSDDSVHLFILFSVSFRVDGVRQLTHLDAAVYSARRMEMLEIVEKSLYYLIDRPVVHSELSGLPYMVLFYRITL